MKITRLLIRSFCVYNISLNVIITIYGSYARKMRKTLYTGSRVP